MVRKSNRFLAALLVFALIGTMALPVYAEGSTSTTVSISGGDLNVGESLVVTVSIAGNPGINSFDLHFVYDENNLSISKITNSKKTAGSSEDSILEGSITANSSTSAASWSWTDEDNSSITDDGILLWAVFTPKDDAVNGDYEISIEKNQSANIFNKNSGAISDSTLTVSAGTIHVSGGIDPETLKPTITTDPASATYDYPTEQTAVAALTVEHKTPTYGTVTYQWKKVVNGGTDEDVGTNSSSYTPTLPTVGTSESYYCIVTNSYHEETYSETSQTATITYNKVDISSKTVTATPATYEFDGEEKEPSFSIDGLDTSAYDLSGTQKATNVGDYTVTATGTGNYTGTTAETTWTITKATPKVTNPYTSEAPFPVYNNDQQYELTDLKIENAGSDQTTLQKTYTVTEGADLIAVSDAGVITSKKAGTGNATVKITVGDGDKNYTTTDVYVYVQVNAKQALDGTLAFDSTTNGTYSGSNQAVSTFVGEATYTNSAQDGKITYTVTKQGADAAIAANVESLAGVNVQDAGTYTVTATYEDSTHMGSVSTEFTIAPKTINVTGTWNYSDAFTYDGNPKTVTFAPSGDDASYVVVSYTGDSNTQTDANIYSTTASFTTEDSNYTIGTTPLDATLSWTINKKTVTVPAAKSDLQYTGSKQTGVEVASEDAGIYTVENGTGTDAGDYKATAKLEDTANYEWATVGNSSDQTIEWSIAKASKVELKAADKNLRYSNTATQSLTISGDGIADVKITNVSKEDTDSILGTPAASGDTGITYALVDTLKAADAGKTATITVTFNSKNYEESTMTLKVTVIDKNDVSGSMTFADGSSIYNGQTQTYEEASYTGTASGTGKITYTYAPDEVKNVGAYRVTATYEDDDNYGQKTATFTINPATLTITGGTVTAKDYDGKTDAEVTAVEFSGLQNGETLSKDTDYTVSGAAFANANAGTDKTVTFTVTLADTAKAKNYTLSDAKGSATGTINKIDQSAAVTITSGTTVQFGESLTLNAEGGSGTGTVSFTVTDGTTGKATVRDSVLTPTQVGDVTVTATKAADTNYNAKSSEATTITITQAAAPASLTNSDVKVKYSNTTKQTVQIGKVPTDAGTVSYAVGTVTDSSILKETPTVSESGVVSYQLKSDLVFNAASPATATISVTVTMQNYVSKTVDVIITLTDKDAVTVSAKDIAKTYDGKELTADDITGTATSNGTKVEGDWTWVTPKEGTEGISAVADMINVNTYQAQVQFTPADTTNYLTPDPFEITVTINKATPTGTPTYTKIETSGKTLADAKLDVGTITPKGTITWDDGEDTKVTANKAYAWTFTPTDTDNYETLTGEITPYVYTYVYEGSSSATARTVTTPKDTENGTVTTDVSRAKAGDTVTITATPDEGYEVESVRVYDADGNRVTVTDNGDGTYSFTMPKRAVTIDAAFTEAAAETETPATFTDVPAGQWYSDAVAEVVERGLFNGYPDGTFQPTGTMTRAMLVTVLWRLDGSDDSFSANRFSDVVAGQWYSTAVDWASNWGIVKGVADDIFGVNENITREQLVTILYRYCQMKGYDVSETAALTGFADADSVSDYASEAMAWAVGAGIIQGYNHALDPTGSATRAQVATILMRFAEKFEA